MSTPPVLNVDHLCKAYSHNNTVVDHLTFSLREGELMTLLGPNGAGKSTAMKMISGFLKPDYGSVRILGQDVQEHPMQTSAALGYLPEGSPSYSHLSVLDFLNFVGSLRIKDKALRKKRLQEVIERLFLEDVLLSPITTLSKGFQRRTCLAQALLHRPPLLMLDEPTDGLDPNQKRQVHALLMELRSEGAAILISTHLLDEVELLADRLLLLHRGRCVANTKPKDIQSTLKNSQALEVFFKHAAPEESLLLSILGDVQLDYQSDPRHLFILTQDKEESARLLQQSEKENSWRIVAMHTRNSPLEEVFSQLTKGSLN